MILDIEGRVSPTPELLESQGRDVAMLMRSEPFRELDRITEQLLSERRTWQLPVDAYRHGNELKVLLDVPGSDPGSIDLTVENDVLSVRAKRTRILADDDQLQIGERGQGDFSRQLFLGESLDRDKVTASYEDGVLVVTIPVIEQARPRKVEIAHPGGRTQVVEAASVRDEVLAPA